MRSWGKATTELLSTLKQQNFNGPQRTVRALVRLGSKRIRSVEWRFEWCISG